MSAHHYPRPALAKSLADQISGKDLLSDAPNGLFLAAPRRTGKSDFLQLDLAPELQAQGMLPIYVDLWDNPSITPMAAVAARLAEVMQQTSGVVAKAARQTGLLTFEIPGTGFKFDASKLGKIDGMSPRQVLSQLREQSKKRIVLIIDEAQHALTSEEGEALMVALKSARDQMKEGGQSALMLVMSGSHRDKLMRLVDSAAAPFWGSLVRPLPTLGADYASSLARDIERSYPQLMGIKKEGVIDAFTQLGERPQFLREACSQAMRDASNAKQFDDNLRQYVSGQRERDHAAITRKYWQQAPVERAVFEHLLESGEKFKPYDAAAMSYYSRQVGETVSSSQAQKALDALRELRLVWKSPRGGYAPYDQDMNAWYVYLKTSRQWPPSAEPQDLQDG